MEGDLILAPARVCPHSPWPSFLPSVVCLGQHPKNCKNRVREEPDSWTGDCRLGSLSSTCFTSFSSFFFFIRHKCFLEFENTRLSQLYSGKEFGTASNAGRLLPRIEAKQAGNMKGAHCICCRSRNTRGPRHLPFLRLKK